MRERERERWKAHRGGGEFEADTELHRTWKRLSSSAKEGAEGELSRRVRGKRREEKEQQPVSDLPFNNEYTGTHFRTLQKFGI